MIFVGNMECQDVWDDTTNEDRSFHRERTRSLYKSSAMCYMYVQSCGRCDTNMSGKKVDVAGNRIRMQL